MRTTLITSLAVDLILSLSKDGGVTLTSKANA